MSSLLLDILSWFCLLAGGLFCVIGALGLLRMPHFYTRAHAAGVCVRYVGPPPTGFAYERPALVPSPRLPRGPAPPGPQPRIEPLPSNSRM